MKNVIYGLVDPRTQELRYIGKAKDAENRYREHMRNKNLAFKTHKNNWINNLKADGLKPELIILEQFDSLFVLDEAEDFWISYFKSIGANLTNSCNGGKGTPGYKHTPENIELFSKLATERNENNKGKPLPEGMAVAKQHSFIDGIEHRECCGCSVSRPLDNFWFNVKQNKYHTYCKKCNANRTKEYRERFPLELLSDEEYNKTRLAGARAGGEAIANNPAALANLSKKLSKAIQGTHPVTGEIVNFPSALKAKEAGFQNTNIGQAIKYNKPYRGYIWKFT